VKKLIAVVAVGLLVCLAAGAVYAAYDVARGEVKSNADGKLVVSVRAGRDAEPKDMTFTVDKDTSVKINGEDKALADITAGKMVQVFYQTGDAPKALLISVFERRGGGDRKAD
jgi:hypothetical protein